MPGQSGTNCPLLPRALMIEPLDRSRRDSTLFQFTTRQLRDFIDPNTC